MSNALPLPPKKVIGGSKFFFHVIIWLTAWGRPWAHFKSRPSTPSPSPPSPPAPSSIVVHRFTVLIELLKTTLLILNLAFFAIVENREFKDPRIKILAKAQTTEGKKLQDTLYMIYLSTNTDKLWAGFTGTFHSITMSSVVNMRLACFILSRYF